MAALRYILRRECKDGDSGAECEKPVNQTMLTVIPTAVMAGYATITLHSLSRRGADRMGV